MPIRQPSSRSLSESDRLYGKLPDDARAELTSLRRSMKSGQRADNYIYNTLLACSRFRDWLDAQGTGHTLATATADDINDWLIYVREQGYAPSTIHTHRAGVRNYYKHLCKTLKIRPDNPMYEVASPDIPETDKDVVSLEDLARVLSELDAEKAYRDAAIISLFADTGIRTSECCAIMLEEARDVTWIDLEACEIVIAGNQAKSREQRIVGYGPATADRIDRWLATRPDKESPWLFTGQPDNGVHKPYTRSGMYQRVRMTFLQHGVKGKIGGHDLRHTWATHTLDHPEARETSVMAQAGWKSAKMLRRYTRQTEMRRAKEQNLRTSPLAQIS